MRCRKIQELLKADYLDGQASLKEAQFIRGHLAQCLACRRLEQALQDQRKLFQGAKQQQVPGRVWQNIRRAIVKENLRKEDSVSAGIFEWLRQAIFAPRHKFVLAGALTTVIFVAIFAGAIIKKKQVMLKENSTESDMEYYLNGANVNLVSDFGTNIEEYFL